MPRPPLPIGAWGRINRTQKGPKLWTAYARFRDHDGVTRQYERTGATAQKAEDALKDFLTKHSVIPEALITADSTLKDVAERWYAQHIDGRKATNTQVRYRDLLDRVIYPGLGGRRMREMSVAALDRFVSTVAAKRGDGTARLCKSILSGALGHAARLGALDANPMRDVQAVVLKTHEVVVLTVEQVVDLRDKMYADRLAILQDVVEPVDYMLGTGERIGEVLALRWSDLELDGDVPTAMVRATVVWQKGVGTHVQEHTKTTSSRRQVTLPTYIADMLRYRRARQRPNEFDLVFPSDRGAPRDPSAFRKHWRRLRDEIGYDWVTPHTFRKTVATLIADAEVAANQLGHSGSAVTKKHYIPRTFIAPDVRDRLEPAFTQRKQLAASGEIVLKEIVSKGESA